MKVEHRGPTTALQAKEQVMRGKSEHNPRTSATHKQAGPLAKKAKLQGKPGLENACLCLPVSTEKPNKLKPLLWDRKINLYPIYCSPKI